MSTSLQTLVDRTRNFLRDTPDFDQLQTSLSASVASNTVGVSDTGRYRVNWPIEVDYETMMIRGITSTGNTLTTSRGWRGAAVATHAANASIMIRPAFFAQEIIDAINTSFMLLYPNVYQPVVDTSLTVQTNQYQYVIPTMPGFTGYPIPAVIGVEILQPGDYTFRRTRRFQIHRGTVTSGSPTTSGTVSSTYPIFMFKSLPPIGAQIRVHGFGPFAPLVNLADTLNPLFPPQIEYMIHKIAAGYILQSAEAGRDRADATPVDRREEANRTGASLSTAMTLLSRSEQELLRTCMPPMPRHIQAVI